jgi:hypothetical protein
LNDDHYDGGFGLAACYAANAFVVAEGLDIAQLLGPRWRYLHPRLIAEEGLPVVGTRWYSEVVGQCNLVRHIFGNPFRPYPSPPSWPSTVVQLAESLYGGQDCAFALHDALLEADHAELAEHFREEKSHPKGCWVVDLILGKE